jgi:translation elongation factor P/translation initiation factor 5A
MLDILLLIIIFWAGFLLGEHVMAWKLRHVLLDYARREGFKVTDDFEMEDPTKPKISMLYIEQEKDTLYLYDNDEKEFVCQAKSVEDLAKLALQYKNIKHAVVVDGNLTFMFFDGKVKQYL